MVIFFVMTILILSGVRGEFTKYLGEKYPGLSFQISFTKIDPLYEKYYAKVTCLDDNTTFPISKSFKTENISEDYIQYKNRNQYNAKLKEIFKDSIIENKIRNVSGGSKTPFQNDGKFTQININLFDNEEHVTLVVKNILQILEEKNISSETIIIRYEKDKHLYEIWLSSDDYSLTEKEIETKVKIIK